VRGAAREALAARRSGVLFRYKLFANCVKRELIAAFATDANCLVDLGCGRGGDLAKWRGAHVRHVVAIDLSSAQLDEARARASPPSGERGGRQGGRQGGRRQGRGGRQGGTQITWKQHDFLTPSLAAAVAHDLKCADSAEGADAVAAMFCVQFAFASAESASQLLSQVSGMLRLGGVFFGTAPDASAILDALRGDQAVTLQPPEVPCVLRLSRRATQSPGDAPGGEFGQGLVFCMEDTVTRDSDALDGAHEYLVQRETLVRLAAAQGLQPILLESMMRENGNGPRRAIPMLAVNPSCPALSAAEGRIARLYFSFAFRKVA